MKNAIRKIISMSLYKTLLLLLVLAGIFFYGQLAAQDQEVETEVLAEEAQAEESSEQESGFRGRLIDFNDLATPQGLNAFFSNNNWTVRLNSSSDYILNRKLTYAKNATNVQGRNLMGVRVNFPDLPTSAYATLKPPVPFNFYQLPEDGQPIVGLITNIGALRSVISHVAGRNYPYIYSMSLRRNNGEKQFFTIGGLLFLGWKELRWDNPYYIEDLRLRSFTTDPLYPRVLPSLRLESVHFYRDSNSTVSGDFVAYVDWIDLIYDKAFSDIELDALKQQDTYVDDDAVWGIYSNELFKTENFLFQEKLKNFEYLEKLEREKLNLPPKESALPEQ